MPAIARVNLQFGAFFYLPLAALHLSLLMRLVLGTFSEPLRAAGASFNAATLGFFAAIVAGAAGDPSLADRTWVLLTEAPDGGWGLAGHANTNEELVAAARAQIASLRAGKPANS